MPHVGRVVDLRARYGRAHVTVVLAGVIFDRPIVESSCGSNGQALYHPASKDGLNRAPGIELFEARHQIDADVIGDPAGVEARQAPGGR